MKTPLLFLALLFSLFYLQANGTTFGLYTLTFDEPNALNIYSGDTSSQSVSYKSQVSTNANGISSGGPGLQSENPLYVHNNYIFAVNPVNNSVSLFWINPSNPTAVNFVAVADSGGEWPNSVTAIDGYACVVNSGFVNGIRCYTYSSTFLNPIPGSDRDFGFDLVTPPDSHTGPAQISFLPDQSGILVSIKAEGPPLLLYTWSNGQLGANYVSSAIQGGVPFGFAFGAGGLLLTDASPAGGNGGVIFVEVQTGSNPNITFETGYFILNGYNGACWTAYSQQTGHFYVANAGTPAIVDLTYSSSGFAIANTITMNTGITNLEVATINGNDYLFQTGGGEVFWFALSTTAAPSLLQNFSANADVNGGGIAVFVPTASTTSGVVVLSPWSAIVIVMMVMMVLLGL